jgi:mono/diheme cytochrome c family protein
MGKFIAGIVFAVIAFIVAMLIYSRGGYMAVNADVTPSSVEHWVANSALDASVERQAPHVDNPVPKTDANLIDGVKLYSMNCAVCHGGLDRKRNKLGEAFYPPAPQILVRGLHDPEWHIFFVVKHGVRLTGMPAWDKVMSDDDMWKITAFVKQINQLPPAVEQQRKQALGATD